MAEFESPYDYLMFADFVKYKARHILGANSLRFLKAVTEGSEKRNATLGAGTILYRSQLANDWRVQPIKDENGVDVDSVEVPIPAPCERMIPGSDRATEGRVNAKGIPCLYLSNDADTARLPCASRHAAAARPPDSRAREAGPSRAARALRRRSRSPARRRTNQIGASPSATDHLMCAPLVPAPSSGPPQLFLSVEQQ
jgi:hypothetical protein